VRRGGAFISEDGSRLKALTFQRIPTIARARERYPQLRSAVTCSSVDAGSSEEDWLWLEEYADQKAIDAFYEATKEDKAFLEIHDKQYDFWRLVVDGSFKDEVHTERARF